MFLTKPRDVRLPSPRVRLLDLAAGVGADVLEEHHAAALRLLHPLEVAARGVEIVHRIAARERGRARGVAHLREAAEHVIGEVGAIRDAAGRALLVRQAPELRRRITIRRRQPRLAATRDGLGRQLTDARSTTRWKRWGHLVERERGGHGLRQRRRRIATDREPGQAVVVELRVERRRLRAQPRRLLPALLIGVDGLRKRALLDWSKGQIREAVVLRAPQESVGSEEPSGRQVGGKEVQPGLTVVLDCDRRTRIYVMTFIR